MIEINGWIILVQLISFLVLLAFLGKFLFSPLERFIEKRKEGINNTFSLINQKEKEASSLIESAEKRLKEAEKEAKEIIEKAIKEGEMLKDEIIKKAKKEAEKISEDLILHAKDKIKKEKQNAIYKINKIAVALASKIIKENISQEKQEVLLSDFIEDIKEDNLRW